jgi:hypothetical protein
MDQRELEVVRRWFGQRCRMYQRAALFPWLPVDPNPWRPPEVLRYFQVMRDHPHITT